MTNKKDLEKIEKLLSENKEAISSLDKCSENVSEKGKRYFDGEKAWEFCKNCRNIYEVMPTQKEISDWNYLVREESFIN